MKCFRCGEEIFRDSIVVRNNLTYHDYCYYKVKEVKQDDR
jgi:hypothetical protein